MTCRILVSAKKIIRMSSGNARIETWLGDEPGQYIEFDLGQLFGLFVLVTKTLVWSAYRKVVPARPA